MSGSRVDELRRAVQAASEAIRRPSTQEPLLLPNGTPAMICTNGALYLQTILGGRVVGYAHEDNPAATLGKREGGHDFLLVDDQYIVDLWAAEVEGRPSVIDLRDPRSAVGAEASYGDPSRWVDVAEASKDTPRP